MGAQLLAQTVPCHRHASAAISSRALMLLLACASVLFARTTEANPGCHVHAGALGDAGTSPCWL